MVNKCGITNHKWREVKRYWCSKDRKRYVDAECVNCGLRDKFTLQGWWTLPQENKAKPP